MQSIVNASTAIGEPARTKRGASPTLSRVSSCTPEPHQPLSRHDSPCPTSETCSCKRQRTSIQHLLPNTQNTLSACARTPPIIWQDNQNREFEIAEEKGKLDHEISNLRDEISNVMAKTATPITIMQDRNSHSGLTASVAEPLDQPLEQPSAHAPSQTEEISRFTEGGAEAVEGRFATARGLIGSQQRRHGYFSTGHSKIHNFYTKAWILSPKGLIDLRRVRVDERSSFNFLPWPIAIDLDLILYYDRVLTITVDGCPIQTNQYCRFTIRVAGVDTAINTVVIPRLQTVLLGQEWIQSVNLLSGSNNQCYYIPIPLIVEAADEGFLNVNNARGKAQDIKLVEMAMADEINKEYNECSNINCCDNYSSDSEPSSSKHSSDDNQSLDGNPSGDELSFDDRPLSDGEISSSEEPISGEYELASTYEGDEDDEFYEDYKDFEECNECDECGDCDECDECDECDKCQNCEECDKCEEGLKCLECQEGDVDTDANLQDFIEQHEHLGHYREAKQGKAAREDAKLESEQKRHRLTCLKDPLDRNGESVEDLAFNIGSQQSEPREERAFPNPHHIDSLKQPTTHSPTEPQMNRDQTPITKHQAKEIANTLNNISRTQVGRSFKAPVEQLWPQYADVYAATVPNPIDLGTMEMKVKNNIYTSLDDFRADAILLYKNSLAFNGINHIITSAALEVRDTILEAVSDMEESKGNTVFRASARRL